MQKDKPTINLSIPLGWEILDDYQLSYFFGLTYIEGSIDLRDSIHRSV